MLTFYLDQNHGGWNSDDNQNNNLGRFRFSVTTAPERRRPIRCRAAFARSWRSRATADAGADCGGLQLLAHDGSRVEGSERPDRSALEAASRRVVAARARARARQPRDDAHARRAAISSSPASPSSRACPAFLHPLPNGTPDDPADVRALAGRSTSRRRPRAPIVNRVWQTYFGTGLVAHQRRLRHAERGAVASGTARLAGGRVHGARLEPQEAAPADRHVGDVSAVVAGHAGAAGRDPDNRLLARGPRFRVEAEVVRDIALAASGLLNPKVGGPSVYPPAPEFLFLPPASYGPKVWKEEQGADRYRRALYTFRFRSVPYPDAADVRRAQRRCFACVRRARVEHAAAGAGDARTSRCSSNVPAPWRCRRCERGGRTDGSAA